MPNIPPMLTHMSQSQQLYQSSAGGGGGGGYSGVTTITAGTGITINPPSGVGNVLVSNGGVTSLVAGTNIQLSPANGVGAVTVSAVAGASAFTTGMILMFNGDVAPAGWALCDGSVPGVPNLSDRFILGKSVTYPRGTTGGNSSATIGITNLPAHQHSLTNGVATVTATVLTVNGGGGGTGIVNNQISRPSGEAGNSATASISGQTDSAGGGQALPILNPFYALAYIMKL